MNGAEALLSDLDKEVEGKVEEEAKQKTKVLPFSVTILKPTSKVELKDPCPFLPSLSNSIDIEWTEARGRFAVANRPIAAGGGVLLGLAEKKMAF